MALRQNVFCFLPIVATFSILFTSCYSFYPKLLNINASLAVSDNQSGWSPAGATWYGGPSIFKSGIGCGACYEVKCSTNSACSGNPVTVVITDECPGCVSESVHFDLSGTSIGAMAKSGLADLLRNAGILQVQYKKVDCKYPGTTIAFHVDPGSNPNYFATLIEYTNGDGDLASVDLKQALDTDVVGCGMETDGAGSTLLPPFSLRLTSLDSRKTIVATTVIPAGWEPGKTYRSVVNFNP
ncbi:Major pollen allergen Lol pI [Gossypium australe]|uniref:Major pollen allergen Lol pI n=1 Tax=Gossypium australe TaxID=47621 RepID=A0A5B6UYL1_9ROSI|nr:Major pollen allergen Lol pI [Gossypium australe]